MFTNKHVIIALIVAPILAVIAYLATDALVGEKAHKAQAGQSYSLVALPNCRYPSGHCTLKNNEFKLEITAEPIAEDAFRIQLSSAHPLQGVKLALAQEQADQNTPTPSAMTATDSSGQQWAITLSHSASPNRLQVVAAAADALYFGETELAFMRYETAFGDDFRSP